MYRELGLWGLVAATLRSLTEGWAAHLVGHRK